MTLQQNAILIDEFDYPLPDSRIAKYPLERRDASKLLIYKNGVITENSFNNISNYLPANSLLVYNNTKVINARMHFEKSTGARIEIFCLEPFAPSEYALSLGAVGECTWKCMIGNLKKWKSGILSKTIRIQDREVEINAQRIAAENGNAYTVKFTWNDKLIHFAQIVEAAGELPIPPYLHRNTEESDLTSYQTVYSKIQGSVAAPTAGLHFTEDVFNSLSEKDIIRCELTLHVGAGTFQPVKTEKVEDHHMHSEAIEVDLESLEKIKNSLGNIIAVGTTSVRTLESLYWLGLKVAQLSASSISNLTVSQWEPYSHEHTVCNSQSALQSLIDFMHQHSLTKLHASTQIMIKPGYQFRVVNGIITNFHQPQSTLLLLVSAFVDGNWRNIYDYALANDFRFLSYGDSSLLLR